MTGPTLLAFGSFQLDLANETLSRGADRLVLKPKSFALLRYLAEHPQRLVTKGELLKSLWPEVAVGEAVLKTCISEIRKALGDHPMRPQFIETVHRRGYRFLVSVSPLMVQPGSPALSHPAASPRPFVGRKVEIAFLDNFWQQCRQGRRQVIFVTGEPGIGKTLLVNVFENTLSADGDVWIGRGQCVEQHGPGEPYLPILEALGRLCREPRGERLVTLLKRLAPTWLAQLPGVIEPAEAEALRPSLAGVTPVRVMRELADAIEAFTAESLLLLVLEDLHALDHSTLEWLAYVARRSGPARLMIIGTYRPADLILRDHPLKAVKHELLVNGHCQELPLDCLNVTEVRDYLGLRLADLPPADQALSSLARVVYSRTEGNPLFMVNIVDYLLTQQLLVRADKTLRLADPSAVRTIPTGLRQFINMRVEQLADADRKVLAAASVAGLDFSTATVAAALKAPLEDVDRSCHELARALQFIASAGTDEWPDGTQSAQYQFVHSLYRETLYGRLSPAERAAMHRRIAERRAEGYGERSGEIAAELALHFEQGQEPDKASHYHQQAGEDALKRSAFQEAIARLTTAVALLRALPSGLERDARELRLQCTLAFPLVLTKSFSSPEVAAAYGRARELCRRFPRDPQLFPAIFGLFGFYITRGDMKSAREMSDELLRLSKQANDKTLGLVADLNRAGFLLHKGDLRGARRHLDRVKAAYRREAHQGLFYQYGMDPGNAGKTFLSWWFWLSGHPDRTRAEGEAAIADARQLGHTYTVCGALACHAIGHVIERDAAAVLAMTEEFLPLASHEGFPLWIGVGLVVRGWAKSAEGNHEEGFNDLEEGLRLIDGIGQKGFLNLAMTFFADAALSARRHQQGLHVVRGALDYAGSSGMRWFETELLRLKGELLLTGHGKGKNSREQEAESCFLQAIKLAEAQGAKWFALRATLGLSRLWERQRRHREAYQKLKKIVPWFKEGSETKDFQEAKRLLDKLK